MSTFVIYGVGFDNSVEHHIKECKKPARTKIYKEMAKKFSQGTFRKFGYMPHKNFKSEKKWLGF